MRYCEALYKEFGYDEPDFQSRWCELAEELEVSEGGVITQQYHPANKLYFLIDGEVSHTIQLEALKQDFHVGDLKQTYTPLGWSGFSSPFRYATTAKAKTCCMLLVFDRSALTKLLYQYSSIAQRFNQFVLESVSQLMSQTRSKVTNVSTAAHDVSDALSEEVITSKSNVLSVREVLQQSLFFSVFPQRYFTHLTAHIEIKQYAKGDVVYRCGGKADGLMLLAQGDVAIWSGEEEGEDRTYLRSLFIGGQVVSWAAFLSKAVHEESAIACTDTTVYFLGKTALEQLATDEPAFGTILAHRLLWLLSSQLRALRVQVIAQKYDQEQIAIQNLLAQCAPQLPIGSQLYKLPHLLANRMTHEEAMFCLRRVKRQGNRLERALSGLCLDVLAELRREYQFYVGLHRVYESVTQAPVSLSSQEVGRRCMESMEKCFEQTRYVIKGEENLPDQPGNIFILNHLVSHPYHALPNGFELALDTHFVSAMVLNKKYGDGGVRVVRRGRGEEYGHQAYYDRLGYIYVHTSESDPLDSSQKVNKREEFYQRASDTLSSGQNLIICPEGTSNWSKSSPGELKAGTFRLAAAMNPEALIIPIAVANFDKRLKNSAVAAVVHEPFRISDCVDAADRDALYRFLKEFQNEYRGYVLEAIALADAHAR